MDAINPTQPNGTNPPSTVTREGSGPADHDAAYRFGRRPTSVAPFPFNERQFARLLILRGRVQDVAAREDRPAA